MAEGRSVALNIDLWFWPLDQPPDRRAQLAAHLTADETARADRFVHDIHRNHYLAGRGRLREILAEYCGAKPAELRFEYRKEGKPSLQEGPAFNLSHSGGWAALAVGQDVPLGIDIEAYRPVDDGVARRFFSAAEYADLSSLPKHQWEAGFFNCWTRKEAVIKAIGLGLSMPLDSFDVTLAPAQPARLKRLQNQPTQADDWTLQALDTGLNTACALAVYAKGAPVVTTIRQGSLPL